MGNEGPIGTYFVCNVPTTTISLSCNINTILASSIRGANVDTLIGKIVFVILNVCVISFSIRVFTNYLAGTRIRVVRDLPRSRSACRGDCVDSNNCSRLITSSGGRSSIPTDGSDCRTITRKLSSFIVNCSRRGCSSTAVGGRGVGSNLILNCSGRGRARLTRRFTARPLGRRATGPITRTPTRPRVPRRPIRTGHLSISRRGGRPMGRRTPIGTPIRSARISSSEVDRVSELLGRLRSGGWLEASS